jgi:hypothetical protein
MKIFEVIDDIINPERVVDPRLPGEYKQIDLYKEKTKNSGINSGVNVSGREDPDDPHMYYIKTHFPSKIKLDAKYAWMTAIQPYVNSNPFLPRYYRVRLQPDSLGRSRIEYKLEKLTPLSDLDDQHLIAVWHRLDHGKSEYTNSIDFDSAPRYILIHELPHTMEDMLSDLKRQNIEPNVDEHLVQALEIINNIVTTSKTPFVVDLHSSNVMVRLPNQLVITDPLYDLGKSTMDLEPK